MSLTIPPPGSAVRVLRHLRHMDPLPKRPKGGKFGGMKGSSFLEHSPKFVQPKDRIAYWNIGPGDEVRVTVGGTKVKDEITGEKKRIPYEGVVATVDLERNLVWIRAGDDAKDDSRVPKNLKHIGSRIKDPDKGPEGGFTPSTAYQIRPVHYSNLQLKLPADLKLPKDVASELDLKSGVYASRMERTKVSYHRQAGHFVWKRYAVVPSTDGAFKIEVPWKVFGEKNMARQGNASNLNAVDDETWIPWNPTNPVKLLPQQPKTSQEALERLQNSIRQRNTDERRKDLLSKEGGVIRSVDGMYEGFAKRRSSMPLIPQPPTASEQIAHTRKEIATWLKEAQSKGKSTDQVFSAMDYIDVTPIEGPSDSRWNSTASLDERVEGKVGEGSSIQIASKEQMDSWPIELLMTNDLTNPKGLRNRMRSWHLKQIEKESLRVEAKMEDAKRVELLRKKVALDKAAQKKSIREAEAAIEAEAARVKTLNLDTLEIDESLPPSL